MTTAKIAGGYWVFANGGLLDSVLVESPPLYHVVNLPGQNAALSGGTLCGWARFKDGCPGGAWRPVAARDVEKGYSDMGEPLDSPGPQVCPRCTDALVALVSLEDWDAFKVWARENKRPRAVPV